MDPSKFRALAISPQRAWNPLSPATFLTFDMSPRNPLQGFRTRTSSGQCGSFKFLEWLIALAFWSGVLVTLVVLALNAYLLASKPVDTPQSWSVVYSIFAALISLAAWIIVKIVTDRAANVKSRWVLGFSVLLVATIIYGGAVGWITVSIQPAKSCSNSTFIEENNLMGGSEGHCRVVYVDVITLWIGNSQIWPFIECCRFCVEHSQCRS